MGNKLLRKVMESPLEIAKTHLNAFLCFYCREPALAEELN